MINVATVLESSDPVSIMRRHSGMISVLNMMQGTHVNGGKGEVCCQNISRNNSQTQFTILLFNFSDFRICCACLL